MNRFAAAMRKGVIWSTATVAGGKLINLLALVVLARVIVPSEFGIVAAILVYLGLLELAADLGMKATVIYEQERDHGRRVETAFTVNLALATMLSAGAVLAAPLIADLFRLGEHADLFRLAALNPLLAGLGNVHDALLLRDLRFRRRAVPELVRGLTRGTASIALALAGLGATALVAGMLVGTAAWTLTLWAMTPFRPRLRLDLGIARSMLPYGGGAVALEVVSAIGNRADVVVIARVLGDSALGLYGLALRVPEMLIESVAWSVSRVAFPALARHRAADQADLPAATLGLLRWQAMYVVPVATLLAVTGPALIVVLFSERWAAAGGVAVAGAVMYGISAAAFPLGDVFKATARQRILVGINLLTLPLLITAIVVVAPSGIVAVAWALAAAQLVRTTLVLVAVGRVLSIGPRRLFAALGPALATGAGAGVGAGAATLLIPAPAIASLAAASLAGLAGAAAALRLFAPSVLDAISEHLARFVSRPANPAVGSEPSMLTPSRLGEHHG